MSVRAIATAVPATVLKQPEVRDLFADQPGRTRLGRRLVGAVFDGSAIDTRHTVLAELGPTITSRSGDGGVYYHAPTGRILSPGTGRRNQTYVEAAPVLFLDAAARALAAAPGLEPADVTHVITVSCTGFYAPGPDYAVVRGLGLSPATQRYHLGFMGCYAAFPALRAARSFCQADPDAVVLVVCVELCTLHLSSADDPDTILASSVFADGAAAAVVTGRSVRSPGAVLELDAFETVLTPTGEQEMAWTIGDAGFEMTLSGYVPKIIERHLGDAIAPLFAAGSGRGELELGDVDYWAIHPGGRSILDRVQRALDLSDAQLDPSREVLRTCGNMSSATVLFILRDLLHGAAAPSGRVCAMAFGPGLTVESALMTRRLPG